MSVITKDLGAATAYAYAVEKGYTGTEAEFAELMADYVNVGQRAENAADRALESKSAAQTAAQTATNKASEAAQAAQTATTKAAEAQADADAAALDASQAMSAASTATSKATEATTAAATAVSSKDAAVSANTAAQSAKTAAQTAQQGAETARDAVQSSAAQITTNAEDITQLKEDLSDVIVTFPYTDSEITYITPDYTVGAMDQNGTTYAIYTTFNYTQKISVVEGDVIEAPKADGSAGMASMRWVCAFSGDTVVREKGNAADQKIYTVPEGIDGIVVTVRIANNVDRIRITRQVDKKAAYIKPIPMGYMSTKGTLASGGIMTLPYQNVKINNCYIFNANITEFSSITFQKSADTYITVSASDLYIHNDTYDLTVQHGLTIGKNITIMVQNTTSAEFSLVRISSDGQVFDYTTPRRFVLDNNTPTIISNGSVLTDCIFSWVSKNVNAPIWMFGDSYFSWYSQRWTYYLAQDGYTKSCMLNGFAGQGSSSAYEALINLLAITVPKQVVWCLGMNDGDSATEVSTTWYSVYEKLIELQKKYGFELILYTVPTTPIINNNFKNAIIRESGYRYIEADKAVRINDNGDWVTGALDTDNTHPTPLGAIILYNRILADLPELMCDR